MKSRRMRVCCTLLVRVAEILSRWRPLDHVALRSFQLIPLAVRGDPRPCRPILKMVS